MVAILSSRSSVLSSLDLISAMRNAIDNMSSPMSFPVPTAPPAGSGSRGREDSNVGSGADPI